MVLPAPILSWLALAGVLAVAGCRDLPTSDADFGDTPAWDRPDTDRVPDDPTPRPDPGSTRLLPDAAYLPALLDAIDAADHHLRVAEFLLQQGDGVQQVVEALERAAARGVTVQVLADEEGGDTARSLAGLRQAGVETRLDSPSVTLHAKLVIADDVVLLGSHNLTTAALTLNREASVLVADAQVAAWYAAWFDDLWLGADASTLPTQPTPDDLLPTADTAVVDALLACLNAADDTIDLVLYALAWDDRYPGSEVDQLLTALTAAHDRDVAVRVVLDGSGWITEHTINDDAILRLRQAGVPVWTTPAQTVTHAKTLRCDDRVVVSDANWSYSGLALYRGVSLTLTDDAVVHDAMTWMDGVRATASPVP